MPAPSLCADLPGRTVHDALPGDATLGELNSRMKDFYDIRLLSRQFDFEGQLLAEAISYFRTQGTDIANLGFSVALDRQHVVNLSCR